MATERLENMESRALDRHKGKSIFSLYSASYYKLKQNLVSGREYSGSRELPKWWNRYTRCVQGAVGECPCEFDSRLRHQFQALSALPVTTKKGAKHISCQAPFLFYNQNLATIWLHFTSFLISCII